ncbi:hypothetical protein GCM10023081_01230 [Arthrobacter ginkgonis]|uniref:Uncharacterized protein n=2 Tax=Arthrobacter ginkgonis TaxID=1630594 RepID=A0ABP7BR03_9MICC
MGSGGAARARSGRGSPGPNDGQDGAGVPGGEFIAEEIIAQVIPQAEGDFTCYSCFLVRPRPLAVLGCQP